jgi:DNA-binding transcriptional regulator YiaG
MKGEEIRALRNSLNLTQTEFAVLLRLADRRTVRRWETDEQEVTGPVSLLLELLAAGELPRRFLDLARESA